MAASGHEGRKAVITGGPRGIGYAIAERLILEGAEVSLWDLDAAALKRAAEALPVEVHTAEVNVADAHSVAQAASQTLEAMGNVDILVNSAGIAGPNHMVWEYPVEAWKDVIEIDLNGTFLTCRALVPGMIEHGYGRIVNIASIAGKEGNPTASAYSAAKAGAIGLTKSLGKETAKTGITVNCITPAAVRTEIFEQVSQAHIDYMLSKIPMERFGLVEEMASMVAWLTSEECSFSTGAVFDISGGRATY